MSDLVVIVPSRGRPEAARTLIRAFRDTCTADTELAFAVDDDDPTIEQYAAAVRETTFHATAGHIDNPSTMVHALNRAAHTFVDVFPPPPFALGFMGDDHCPRTVGWDRAYLDTLRELGTGIVYGNDLLQGSNLPTQCVMTSDIIRTLGHMVPPTLRHMYADNFWRDLGQAAGCLRYLPDVVVEHLHPIAGKAEWDAGYIRVNDRSVYATDAAAYQEYLGSRFAADVEKVKALRGTHG